ncbi:TrbG/VirB9 family P-type conjugative transfer protein [Noviherbaspirillum pedocola]|uniref:TrbG/VirB9 family P-type conjugative transfer protein n=1 Tax=Noviherbaspirillum pedocola TaxID=2801341 RepID=A0A934T092_9BURK|nr:TrbG/VirB9 family P-type conjugative transfer protein [Noviherbaspirillum pedocola]MBK4736079.1 TrbG/VirB9 family P-type conjugative transfer protein [Noviherbaspirillum pedocola]
MKRALTLAIAALLVTAAHAAPKSVRRADPAAESIAAPSEERIRTYTYDPNIIFKVNATVKKHAHIKLEEGEKLKYAPVLGDTIQWRVAFTANDLFIKPSRPDITTTMTVITNKRTYEFELNSIERGAVYQQVSFSYPDSERQLKLLNDESTAAASAEKSRLASQIIQPSVDVTALDYNYDIVGTAPFKPEEVSNDGKFTYLRMPATQAMPAVFLLDAENKPSLVAFRQKGNFIVVERVADALLLKIGNDEVRVTKRGVASKVAAPVNRSRDVY